MNGWQLTRLIFELPKAAASSAERLVLLALAEHHNSKTGACHPSVGRIARKTALSERGVRKALSRLEAKGLLTIRRTSGGLYATNEYRLTIPVHLPTESQESSEDPPPQTCEGPRKAPSLPKAAFSTAESASDPAEGSESQPEAFIAFRDPDKPPDWCETEDWATACHLADLVEVIPTGVAIEGSGGFERACDFARLLQDAGRGNVIKISREQCLETIEALTRGGGWKTSPELRSILEDLQKYPDGAYPNLEGRNGSAPPSRIERAWRIIQKLEGKTLRQSRQARGGGFAPAAQGISEALAQLERKMA